MNWITVDFMNGQDEKEEKYVFMTQLITDL